MKRYLFVVLALLISACASLTMTIEEEKQAAVANFMKGFEEAQAEEAARISNATHHHPDPASEVCSKKDEKEVFRDCRFDFSYKKVPYEYGTYWEWSLVSYKDNKGLQEMVGLYNKIEDSIDIRKRDLINSVMGYFTDICIEFLQEETRKPKNSCEEYRSSFRETLERRLGNGINEARKAHYKIMTKNVSDCDYSYTFQEFISFINMNIRPWETKGVIISYLQDTIKKEGKIREFDLTTGGRR
jgi:hypothetical protein